MWGRRKGDERVNIGRSWEVDRIASNIDGILWLIYPNPINAHGCRERQRIEDNISKILREPQVGNNVLSKAGKRMVLEREGRPSPLVLLGLAVH